MHFLCCLLPPLGGERERQLSCGSRVRHRRVALHCPLLFVILEIPITSAVVFLQLPHHANCEPLFITGAKQSSWQSVGPILIVGPAIDRTVLKPRRNACQGPLLSFHGHALPCLCMQYFDSLCLLPLVQDDPGTYGLVEGQDILSAWRNSLPLSHLHSLSLHDRKSCITG